MTGFSRIYSSNGKEIFPRNGMTIPVGSMIQTDRGEFVTLDRDHVYTKTTEWDNTCQSRDTTQQLTPKE
jgi:hypothetical protein